MRHPVHAAIFSLVQPFAVVFCAVSACFVIVHDVQHLAVDLEAPDRGAVLDAQVPSGMHGQIGINIDLAMRLSRSASVISLA